jgi:peptidyl-prolyl cis-trans isomerase C
MKNKTYQVKHILVQHRYEAEDLLKRLSNPIAFEELAQKHSICPSASQGGDLGIIQFGQADPDFEEAVESLKPGEVTKQPIRTRFGYHLIFRIK